MNIMLYMYTTPYDNAALSSPRPLGGWVGGWVGGYVLHVQPQTTRPTSSLSLSLGLAPQGDLTTLFCGTHTHRETDTQRRTHVVSWFPQDWGRVAFPCRLLAALSLSLSLVPHTHTHTHTIRGQDIACTLTHSISSPLVHTRTKRRGLALSPKPHTTQSLLYSKK